MDAVVSEVLHTSGRTSPATPSNRAGRTGPLWIVEIPVTAGAGNGRQICAVRARSEREALDEALRRALDPAATARRRGAALDPDRATVTPWDWQQTLL
ncbi:hypothetical protein [Kitasatospora sp. NPDC056181]|uniref:hypothetical protein n=1 Tax=Kitasatospora sp. NPDC056181 TaxID=3345737 RepID=UPI0035D98581